MSGACEKGRDTDRIFMKLSFGPSSSVLSAQESSGLIQKNLGLNLILSEWKICALPLSGEGIGDAQ